MLPYLGAEKDEEEYGHNQESKTVEEEKMSDMEEVSDGVLVVDEQGILSIEEEVTD
jgi:hypothetical protein